MQIAAKDRFDHITTNLNVKLAKHRDSVPNCQNIRQKQVSQLKSHIGKPFTTREGVLDLSFVLGYADSTSSKFRVSAYSQDRLMAE